MFKAVPAKSFFGNQRPSGIPSDIDILDIEILIDRNSVEAFFDNGKMVMVNPLQSAKNQERLVIKADGNQLLVHNLEVYELKSIWEGQ